jgi:phosphopentomutase
MTVQKQCVLVVLDSVGIGELPDAVTFGDAGSDTLGHIDDVVGLHLPNLAARGLAHIARSRPFASLPRPEAAPTAAYGRLAERSRGKDSATGHWELMGLPTDVPFRTYPSGFPDDFMGEFIARAGIPGILGNEKASGTEIIERLGREHVETGKPIIYTSADPVFQIAAHEGVIPIERLYELCELAYELSLPRGLNRVIARPFVGAWPDYERTYRRKDFTMPPPGETTLDGLAAAGVRVASVGKIEQLFAGRGITDARKSKNNQDGVEATLDLVRARGHELVFTNLVDFDSLYGHRRDPPGYAAALEAFDAALPELVEALGPEDVLFLTADHGNDPTFAGTDHTREYVPVIAIGAGVHPVDLGTRESFADLGATVADFLGYPGASVAGESFLSRILPQASGGPLP